jgi:succinoglycan biosynthesis protein ExoL
LRIAYFVHDTSDAAVLRRVRMLHEAGAEVAVLGFRRPELAPDNLDGAPVIDLGRTYDGRFIQRAWRTATQSLGAWRLKRNLPSPDVVLARNLEMLTLAAAARLSCGWRARLAYECLDIHRLMLSDSLSGRGLRALERGLLRRAELIIVSSPAHVRAYFERFHGLPSRPRILLLENKVFEPEERPGPPPKPIGPPWRIGWFGMLRCRRSLQTLRRLVEGGHGLVEVVVAGRPSSREFHDFQCQVAGAPGFKFLGAYDPADLDRLYHEVHFSWAIDYFEAGANSEWLLPNRLYEGGRHGAVPIGLSTAEAGRWLERRGLGVVVRDPVPDLLRLFEDLDAEAYRRLEARSRAAPRSWFAAGQAECLRLVKALEGAA